MALLGGGVGGAGNPVGGNFTGAAQALEIVGDHAYAASGVINDNTSGSAATTMLKFTSGNFYFVGWLNFSSDETSTGSVFLDLKYNGTSVIASKEEHPAVDPQYYYILIPAYTEVELKWGSSGSKNATAFLTGRIYR